MEYLVAAYTDAGTQKMINQDSICIRRASVSSAGEIVMAVVCDGMGGMNRGELASAEAVNTFGAWFDQNLNLMPKICADGFLQVRRQWLVLVDSLHQRLREHAEEYGGQMGTTLTALLTFRDRYLAMNIGDSRIYEQKRGIRQLTQDQSLVAREIAAGRITEEEGRYHPQRNVLLQCIGAGKEAIPAFTEGNILDGTLFLLCSDGLSHELTRQELEDRLPEVRLNTKSALTSALVELTELCKTRGEADNISSVLIKAKESRYSADCQKRIARILQKFGRHSHKATEEVKVNLLEAGQITHLQGTIHAD